MVGSVRWIKRWLVRLAFAVLAAAVILFPSSEPTAVTAKPIILDGRESIYALAYIAEDVPLLPARLMGSGWLTGPEHLIAGAINFEDPDMADAKVNAWVAANFIENQKVPETWVDLDTAHGEVLNVIACPSNIHEAESGCLAEKPYAFRSILLGILESLQTSTPNSGSPENHELKSAIEYHKPIEVAGRHGFPVVPKSPGEWTPVLDDSFTPLPQEGGLGLWIGRSVGLAYYLAYLDHLGGPLVPEGMRVAATGMIVVSPTGSARVRRIAGLEEKAQGALREGVNVIFVPLDQARDIGSVKGMTVVEVGSPYEAVRWLCQQGSESKYCFPQSDPTD